MRFTHEYEATRCFLHGAGASAKLAVGSYAQLLAALVVATAVFDPISILGYRPLERSARRLGTARSNPVVPR